jgi:uridine kinase
MSLGVNDVAERVARSRAHRLLVAVDGVDGSGKTTLAGHLAGDLQSLGRRCLVIHADDFMHTRAVRHRRGRSSPEGYFHDSYDYASLTRYVLEPLGRDGDGWFRAGTVDRARDKVTPRAPRFADPETVTIVEGLFLHRDELVDRWDFSVFLAVDPRIALARKARRDGVVLQPGEPLTQRYVEGQRLYLDGCRPHERATWVLDDVEADPRPGPRSASAWQG